MLKKNKPKIGIPRALLYYKYFPFWKTFLEELGLEVITSGETNKKILTEGIKAAIDETCLSIKVFLGHVYDLIGKVDFLFIPRVESVERNHFVCSKFLGLPDIVRNAIEDAPPILSCDIDFNKRSLYQSMFGLGWKLTRNPFKIHWAYRKAKQKQQNFEKILQKKVKTPYEVIKLMETGQLKETENKSSLSVPRPDLKIGLLGHAYNIYDNFINMEIVKKVTEMGAAVVTAEMLPHAEVLKEAKKRQSELYWTYEKEIAGAAYLLVKQKVDGIIFIISFPCGPNALTIEHLIRQIKNQLPVMTLVMDEHQSQAGVLTRLEAFLDLVRSAKNKN